jgi:uncharacterized protein (TIGR03437 family)
MCAVALASGLAVQAEDGARRAAPSYTAASIVNSGSYTAGPLAPNTLGTIFGTELSFTEEKAAPNPTGALPPTLAGIRVVVAGIVAPLYYVSPGQVNFIVPSYISPGEYKLYVDRQGLRGPLVDITIADASPALFRMDPDLIIATHADGSTITQEAPAHPGEVIVIYATGLGGTDPALPFSGAPMLPLVIRRAADLRVLLNGTPVEARSVAYAGVTPRWLGLYQVNVVLPDAAPSDPEVQLVIGAVSSASGLHLPLR